MQGCRYASPVLQATSAERKRQHQPNAQPVRIPAKVRPHAQRAQPVTIAIQERQSRSFVREVGGQRKVPLNACSAMLDTTAR
jgi:uncharacterized MAPEG superfamily protein